MSIWSACLLSLLLLSSQSCAAGPLQKARQATVTLSSDSAQKDIFCTGVAVGRRTIQTQQHCMDGALARGMKVYINGVWCPELRVVAEDGHDNVLVRSCQEFKTVVKYTTRVPQEGERAYHWGHPMGLPLSYREGYLSWIWDIPIPDNMPAGRVYVWVMEATGGDSGGGIFDKRGNLLCTVSFGIHRFGDGYQTTACYPPMFTTDQWKLVQ